MLSFALPDEFIDRYVDRRPHWGFRDAGGNSLGELAFVRSYSRIKPCEDHNSLDDECSRSKEQWWEVCRRVIEGMYHEQRKWCETHRIPWDYEHALESATEAYDLLFHRKWAPPGRGLAVMGTAHVHLFGNSAALQNCFRGTEKIITKDGVRSLIELVGESTEVFAKGSWHKAEVKDFGIQPVQRVTFAPATLNSRGVGWRAIRSNHRVDVVVTPDHRWFTADGRTTTDLRVGDVVPAEVVTKFDDLPSYYEGFRHGLIFADGSMSYRYVNGDYRHDMRLCGAKAQHVTLFDHATYPPSGNGDPVVTWRSRDNYKELPTRDDPAYLSGFVRGWCAGDATKTPTGSYALSTQNHGAYEWLLEHAALSGHVITGQTVETGPSNYGERSAPLYCVTLTTNLTAWKVVTIEELNEPERVYCAVVPGVERFTLASGILTSNCAFISTSEILDDPENPAEPFVWLMEASMLGVGVGFDTLGADLGITIQRPDSDERLYRVPDTREGWCESTKRLINSYLLEDEPTWVFDYSRIRPAGAPIKTFGGTAAGPGPLIELHDHVRRIFGGRTGQALTSSDIVDLMNLIGKCVVSGNVRRSAEIALGHPDDKAYLDLKDWEKNPVRMDKDTGWGWTSNNSVFATVGMDYGPVLERVLKNGEPGLVWMDVTRRRGRIADLEDDRDVRAQGYNPCGEQPLESREMCTLVNLYPTNCVDIEEFRRATKYAYLYAKTVTLISTHWPRTNAIMQRNRRIGTSFNGAWQFVERKGYVELDRWMNEGWDEILTRDKQYSEWLCVRESNRHTTVKPDGTGGLLAGATPGAHANPGGEFYIRRIRYAKDDPVIPLLKRAGYKVEPALGNLETTVVAEFPIAGPTGVRSQNEASVYEKVALAARLQRYWSDNSVSFTLTYDPLTEAKAITHILSMFEGQLKTISFLPSGVGAYPQMPYEEITREEYEEYTMRLFPLDWDALYGGHDVKDAEIEGGCTTDVCDLKAAV